MEIRDVKEVLNFFSPSSIFQVLKGGIYGHKQRKIVGS